MTTEMIFLEPEESFERNTESRTDEEQLKYVMALPHIQHESCWCFPSYDITDDSWLHHYPH